MNFKKYINEATGKDTAVMAFGRFNPPTVGHEKLMQTVRNVADEHEAKGHVFASHSELKEKDPLPQKAKIGYLNQIAHGNEIHGSSSAEPTFLHAASKLYSQGHKHLVMVAGSDRVKEYQSKLDQYNDGKDYPHGKFKFKSIKVVSSGERDPDAEGVEGMSGTKMRDLARNNKHKQFENGLPVALKDNAKEISDYIRAVKTKDTTKAPAKPKAKEKSVKATWPHGHMKEDYDNPYRFDDATPEGTAYMQKVTPGQKVECLSGIWSEKLGTCVSVREAYVQNEIFKLNDIVEATNGDKGPIVFRGSSYVTIQVKENKTVKHWLKNIQEVTKVAPEVIQKPSRKIMEKQIPALFLSKEKLAEMLGTAQEQEVQTLQKVKETITMKDLRNKIAEAGVPIGTMTNPSTNPSHAPVDIARGLPDPSTAHRDINFTSIKNTYFGIDKTYSEQGLPGKPPGLVSFKTFVSNPEVQAVELDKMEQEAEAQLAKGKLQQHTAAYDQMRKHKAMDHI